MAICELQSRLMGDKSFTLVMTYPHARHSGLYNRVFQFRNGEVSYQTYYFDDSGSDRRFYILQKISAPKKLDISKVEKTFSDLKSKSVFKFIDFIKGIELEESLKLVFKEHIHHFNSKCKVYF